MTETEDIRNAQSAIEDPPTPFVRWGALVEWLGRWGFTESEVRKFKREGLIEAKFFNEQQGRAYYRIDQVRGALGLE